MVKKNRNKYLGKRVRDVGRRGLSNASEFYAIIRSIISDVKRGRISRQVGRGRLLLLYRLTYKKNNSNITFGTSTAARIRAAIKKAMSEL